MATEIERMVAVIEARTAGFERSLTKVQQQMHRAAGGVEGRTSRMRSKVENDFKGMASSAASAIGSFGRGFAVGAVSAGITGITAAAKAAVSSLSNMSSEAQKAGVGVEAFQRLSYAARQSGVTVDALTDGLKEMALRADEFVQTSKGSGAEAFQRLGYGADELKRKLKDPEALFREIIGRLRQLNTAAQIRVADEIFGGEGGEQFVRLIALGANGIKKLGQEAQRSGVVVKQELVDEAVKLDQKYNQIADIISGRVKSAVVSVASELLEWGSNLDSFGEKAQKWLNGLGNSDFFKFLNDWTSNSYTTSGDFQRIDPKTMEARKRFNAATDPAIDALSKLKIAADAASTKLDEIVIPSDGFAVSGSSANSPFASGDAISDYVKQVVKAESGGRADAKNPNSSATGVGQFIKSTWLDLFRQVYPEQARTMGESAILALRNDAEISKNLIEQYAKNNAVALRNAGQAVTNANLHLAHFLGPQGAIDTLRAAPGARTDSFLGADQINANKSILAGRTREDVLAYADRRANAARVAAGDLTEEEKQAEAKVKSYEKVIEALERETAAVGANAEQKQLQQELEAAGVAMDSAEGQAIAAKVAALHELKAAREADAQATERARDAQREFADIGADATKGIVADLKAGKSAAEAFSNALDRIITKLTDNLIDSLFANLFKTGAGGGGGLLSLFGGARAAGGPVAANKAYLVGEKGPELFAPGRSGSVIPNHRIAAVAPPRIATANPAGGRLPAATVNFRVTVAGPMGDKELKMQMQQMAKAAGNEAYRTSLRDGARGSGKIQYNRDILGQDY